MSDKYDLWIAGRLAHIDKDDDLHEHAPRAYRALSAAIAPMREHYEAQVARAEKFGRTESECVCEICRAMAGIDAALFPKPIIVDEAHQIARSPESEQWFKDLMRQARS